MKKIVSYILSTAVTCIALSVQAQVKTKIFFEEIPASVISIPVGFKAVQTVTAPSNFNTLLQNQNTQPGNVSEYKNKFATGVKTNIDFIRTATITEEGNYTIYYLLLKAENALNISCRFSKFDLSPNAVLSIFNDHELTDSITAKENNNTKIWATRVYQGNQVHIRLKVPKNEKEKNKLTITQVGFGFRIWGGEFYGLPGASATCNINVLCPQGNGWENERKSVALIVSDGYESCTGTLVMNTCGTDIPYLLTANHCLDYAVQNWVFQFQTWSNTCSTNGSYREDLQFNGCTVKANNAATDFALVQLNQIPPANSGITYAGWTRAATPALSSAGIHHPMGDLMKISVDFHPAISVPWYSGASNHWRAAFDEGIIQHGSSGSALFDQNHRVAGQLHGNQNNSCVPDQHICWCITQKPAIGEYGRFDISWTGGGTNSTRLSNWLDNGNTGAVTTNTTNVAVLEPHIYTPVITGSDVICNVNTTQIYSVNLPAGASAAWTGNPDISITLVTQNGSQVSVTRLSPVSTTVYLTATISSASPEPCNPPAGIYTAYKLLKLGAPDCHTRKAYWYVNNRPALLSNCNRLTQIRTINSNQHILANTEYYANAWIQDLNATSVTWSYVSSSGSASWSTNGDQVEVAINTNSPNGWIRLKCTTSNSCGSYAWDFWFTPQGSSAICQVFFDPQCIIFDSLGITANNAAEKILLSPNPSNGAFTVTLVSEDKNAAIKEIIITNKMGFPVLQQKFANNQKTQRINLFGKPTDIYNIRVFDGNQWQTKKLSLHQ